METARNVVDTGVAGRGGRHHRDAEELLERRRVDLDAEVAGLVLQVEHQHLAAPELGELHGQVEHPAEVLGVPHLEDDRIRLGEHDVAGDLLVLGLRRERVRSRRVDDLGRAGDRARDTARDLHRRPGVVGDRDVAPRQRAEDHALAHVRVAHEQQRGSGVYGGVCGLAHPRVPDAGGSVGTVILPLAVAAVNYT